MKSRFWLQLLIILIVSSIASMIFLKFYPVFKYNESVSASEVNIEFPQKQEIEDMIEPKESPSRIEIATIGLDLPIAPGIISDGKWVLYDDKASWLSTSEVPGFGNVILYAHNKVNLFGGLNNLTVGDEITIQHKGKNYLYSVISLNKVLPMEVNAVLSDENRLTLYTCDGAFDQKRLVVIANPVLQN